MNSYIHRIYVHHNYVKRHFEIDMRAGKKDGFKNFIITGKNGTGKTTLLKAINKELFQYKIGILPTNLFYNLKQLNGKEKTTELDKMEYVNPKVELVFGQDSDFINEDLLVIYIPTHRNIEIKAAKKKEKLDFNEALESQKKYIEKIKQNSSEIGRRQLQATNLNFELKSLKENIENLNKEIKGHLLVMGESSSNAEMQKSNELIHKLSQELREKREKTAKLTKDLNVHRGQITKLFNEDSTINPYIRLSTHFLQYLIDMKERQAYAFANEEEEKIKFYTSFFKRLENLFKDLYEDSGLKLKHNFKETNFYFEFRDGRTATFDQMADGFKSILVVISEILLQKEAFIEDKNLEIDPSGIVLIDELEAHLHLSLQEKILPALTKFFPKLQFVIATHSPQICASDKNSVIYDLSSGRLEREYLGGISYDVLSKAHFGLESEYSIEVTALLNRIKKLLAKENKTEKDMITLRKLEIELTEISPELAYELTLSLKKYANA